MSSQALELVYDMEIIRVSISVHKIVGISNVMNSVVAPMARRSIRVICLIKLTVHSCEDAVDARRVSEKALTSKCNTSA